jgi:putative ABC transport system permease protein
MRWIRAFLDTLDGALGTLTAHKLRAALTLLGIVIGVVAVVSMAATVEGLRRAIDHDLGQLGTGVFQVQKQPVFGDRMQPKYERRKNFTLANVALLQQRCESCLHVAGEVWQFGDAVKRPSAEGDVGTSRGLAVVGGTAEVFDNNGYALASGRLFDEGEALAGSDVVVLGSDVVDLLFPGEDPVGQNVRIRGKLFRVIGTLVRRGSALGGSEDNLVTIPIASYLTLFGTQKSLNITIQARDPGRVGRAQDEVKSLLRKARGVPPEADDDFEMFSNSSIQETFARISGAIAFASIGICAIALLIGGIGVMNIMLVAVTERTSEIGLRRALGARRRRILLQFVIEAVLLTTAGGILGIILGGGVSLVVKILVSIPTVVPAWAVMLSITSSASVGLLFGIYPAWRASRLDPIEAMRHE